MVSDQVSEYLGKNGMPRKQLSAWRGSCITIDKRQNKLKYVAYFPGIVMLVPKARLCPYIGRIRQSNR